mgnify:CR=1 FL=1
MDKSRAKLNSFVARSQELILFFLESVVERDDICGVENDDRVPYSNRRLYAVGLHQNWDIRSERGKSNAWTLRVPMNNANILAG